MPRHDISNKDDIIDSRDVIRRIRDLESERESLEDDLNTAIEADADSSDSATEVDVADAREALAEWDEGDEAAELKALKAFADEASGYCSDWSYGATLIHESYFPDYCRQMVVDIGDLPNDIPAYLAIDWDTTADTLRADYTEVDFDGETYLVR